MPRKILCYNLKKYKCLVSYIEEKTLQLIPVMSFALMFACIEALLGLLLGIFYAIVFGAIFSTIPNSVSGITLNGLGIHFSEATI